MQQKVIAEPFLFDSESKDEPTEFEIFFRTEKYEYRYYLAVLKDEISAETLDRKTIGGKKPAHIFYRVIIPAPFEPPVRSLRATLPAHQSHTFR